MTDIWILWQVAWVDGYSNSIDFCLPFGPSMALISSLSSTFQSVKDTQAPPHLFLITSYYYRNNISSFYTIRKDKWAKVEQTMFLRRICISILHTLVYILSHKMYVIIYIINDVILYQLKNLLFYLSISIFPFQYIFNFSTIYTIFRFPQLLQTYSHYIKIAFLPSCQYLSAKTLMSLIFCREVNPLPRG